MDRIAISETLAIRTGNSFLKNEKLFWAGNEAESSTGKNV